MPAVFVIADNIVSPLGATTEENFSALKQGISGIREHHDTSLADEPFYAALFGKEEPGKDQHYTRFEQLLIDSLSNSLRHEPGIAVDRKTVLIISSTKGNINRVEKESSDPDIQHLVSLPASAKLIAAYFGFVNPPIVVSNACISGIMAIITGMRLIRSGQYDHAVIAGADLITKFILSTFPQLDLLSWTRTYCNWP